MPPSDRPYEQGDWIVVTLGELVGYLDERLEVGRFQDYCPNGLQVEGHSEVRRIVGGVTACRALLEAAASRQADAVLVHHGYFWKGEDPRVVGMKAARLRLLLNHGMSLLAYHLPLDFHPELGNNVQLAKRLGLSVEGPLALDGGAEKGLYGHLGEPVTAVAFAARIAQALGRVPLHVSAADSRRIRRVGWCTGAAQGFIEEAAARGLDAYVSGEISEYTVHVARELGVHYFAAGHHATERYGVQALGRHLVERFGIVFEFVDIDNPV